jgi:hypothetical protein
MKELQVSGHLMRDDVYTIHKEIEYLGFAKKKEIEYLVGFSFIKVYRYGNLVRKLLQVNTKVAT